MEVRVLIEYLSLRKTRTFCHFLVLPGIRKHVPNQQLELEQILSDLFFNLIIKKSLIIPKVSRAVPCPCDIDYMIIV